LTIQLEPKKFSPAFDDIWVSHLIYQFNSIQDIRQQISYLKYTIQRCNFISNLRANTGSFVTCTFACSDLDWVHKFTDSNNPALVSILKNEQLEIANMLRIYCKEKFALIGENAISGVKIHREKGSKLFIAEARKSNFTQGYSVKKFQDRYKSKLNHNLISCDLIRHYHAVLSVSDYKIIQKQAKQWRHDLNITMTKAKGTVKFKAEIHKLSQYLAKCNIVPSSSEVPFNRYRFDIPLINSRLVQARLNWHDIYTPVSTFTGRDYDVDSVIIYLKSVIRELELQIKRDEYIEKHANLIDIQILAPKLKRSISSKPTKPVQIYEPQKWRLFCPYLRRKMGVDPPKKAVA
jgi:hypothetical protein